MSRTDVHAPNWVKQKDPLWRDHFQEIHDHSDGVCNLNEYLNQMIWSQAKCYITFRWQGRQIHCGCGMCTDRDGRRLKRRWDRREVKRGLRNGDWDNLDVEVRRDIYWLRPAPPTRSQGPLPSEQQEPHAGEDQ